MIADISLTEAQQQELREALQRMVEIVRSIMDQMRQAIQKALEIFLPSIREIYQAWNLQRFNGRAARSSSDYWLMRSAQLQFIRIE